MDMDCWMWDAAKKDPAGLATLKYKIRSANVYVTPDGFHFIDYLDAIEQEEGNDSEVELSENEVSYIRHQLQSNEKRFLWQSDLVASDARSIKPGLTPHCLDIGCGGGKFLTNLQKHGFEVRGIELNPSRVKYAKDVVGLSVTGKPIEDSSWDSCIGTFDCVTLWDVIEHVNFPIGTLSRSAMMLKPGGRLYIDTPSRDGAYHRFGELTYHLTFGRFPTLLNSMYSASRFAHKQIFSRQEIRSAFEGVGLRVERCELFHELSFPTDFYLKNLLRSERLSGLLAPAVDLALRTARIKNKMLVVGVKDG